MFAVTPYAASGQFVKMKAEKTIFEWKPCRVVGVNSTGEEPSYVVELRSKDGSFYLENVDMIRKPEPRNNA